VRRLRIQPLVCEDLLDERQLQGGENSSADVLSGSKAIVRSASGNGCNSSLSSQPVGIGQRQPLAGLRPSSRGAGAADGRAPEKLQMQMLVFRFTAMATVGDSAPHAVHDGRRPFWFVAVRWPRQAGMTLLTRRPLPSNRRPMPSCL
jgi:hypothetical protein